MVGLGMIHDLAETEIRVRKALQQATNKIHVVSMRLNSEKPLDYEEQKRLRDMLFMTQQLIHDVVGD